MQLAEIHRGISTFGAFIVNGFIKSGIIGTLDGEFEEGEDEDTKEESDIEGDFDVSDKEDD